MTSYDWEHISEGLGPFYFYGLSRPGDPLYEERLRRFAGFYLNEDPGAPNYDSERRLIRSLFNGSRGPKMTPATVDDWDGPVGFIHQVAYDKHLANHDAPEDCEYYMCGPPLMISAVQKMLTDLGVPQENVMFDDFGS